METISLINKDLVFKKYIANPLENNIWLIYSQNTQEALIIDTPPDFEIIDQVLKQNSSLYIKNIFITHNHYDHIDGLEYIYNKLSSGENVKIWIGQKDQDKLPAPFQNYTNLYNYENYTDFKINETKIKFIHTPGHTYGSTCILIEDHIYTGDTLFPGGPGRTTSNENFQTILNSIKTKLLILPDNTIVHPGHGKDTNIKQSINEYNTFIKQNKDLKKLSGNISWV